MSSIYVNQINSLHHKRALTVIAPYYRSMHMQLIIIQYSYTNKNYVHDKM